MGKGGGLAGFIHVSVQEKSKKSCSPNLCSYIYPNSSDV